MKHMCVNKYNAGYPTLEETKSNSMLLQNTPERWKSIAFICTALSTVTLSSCTKPEPPTPWTVGDIAQPRYNMTEDEAIQVIVNEAKLYGINFDTENTNELVAELPTKVTYDYSKKEYDYSVLKTKFKVDGLDKDKNISFEYFSKNDVFEWSDYNIFEKEEIMDGFLKKYMGTLKDNKLKTEDDHITGAFYVEPTYHKSETEEELRKQVKSFIEMLKDQGIL